MGKGVFENGDDPLKVTTGKTEIETGENNPGAILKLDQFYFFGDPTSLPQGMHLLSLADSGKHMQSRIK